MKETKQQKFLRFIMESDMQFFEQFLSELSENELQKFLDQNPDFLKD